MVLRSIAAIIVLYGVVLGDARADPESDADAAFRAALVRAEAGDPAAAAAAIDALEALGAARPITRWTDNAWSEAARLAETARDYARARRDLEQVIALGTDEALVRRARSSLAHLEAMTGGGRWDAVARDHERLVAEIIGGGDPRPALAALEELVRANPGYPRATAASLAIAEGWERDGEPGRAIEVLRAALAHAGSERTRVMLALVRAEIRSGAFDGAAAGLAELEATPGTDHASLAEVRATLDTARHRASIRLVLWSVVIAIAALAAFVLRRDAGSWRGGVRRLARPPLEVMFLVPIGGVLVAVSWTGNPLVARALLAIVLVGIAVAWISGAMLDAARQRRGRIDAARAFAQAVLAIAVVGCATYLAVDRDRMIDLVVETWKHGPAPR